jgi:hypothetical protein
MSKTTIPLTTGVTGTLPVANGGTGISSGTSGQFLKFTGSTTVASAAVDAGISMANQWRLTSDFTGDATPITSNLEAIDTYGNGSIGTAMTVSSGVFTFPSTGIYFIQAQGEFYYAGDSRYNQLIIEVTTDNSNYNEAAKSTGGIAQAESSTTHTNSSSFYLFDVTNVSTHKVRFTSSVSDNSVTTYGNTGRNQTCMTFIRLGDT